MQEKFNLYRKQYPIFRYKSYNIAETVDEIILTYNFEIDNLTKFSPYIKILKKQFKFNGINNTFFSKLVFNIGLIELVSYWKATCSPRVIIECGILDGWQISWFKKLYFNGLGEFFYVNNIKTNINDFMEISSEGDKLETSSKDKINLKPINNSVLIPIGGGKDSCVTMELLKNVDNKYCIMVNPKKVSLECANIAGFTDEKTIEVYRKIDNNLIDLNAQGFLNGHTPFSSLLAFITYAASYLLDIKYIALSNESSANESNIMGEKINHQYSKSFEFENDFREYCKKYLNPEIEYFSFLRPLNELQIAMLFSKYEKYHKVFRSCNVGSKNSDWKWCCNCPKCLFVFIILSPFLYKRSEFSEEPSKLVTKGEAMRA